MTPKFVYITCADTDAALALGRALVGERLAACANVLPQMQSVYWWEGELCEDSEAVLILKTSVEVVAALIERTKALHDYDCPCIVVLPIEDGNPDYLRWIADESAAP